MPIRMQKLSLCLWFDHEAEEAAKLYTSIFPNSKIMQVTRYGEAGREVHRQTPGTAMAVVFELDGLRFTALNGGPLFKFTEAISLMVTCDSQEEIDRYWEKLSAGGQPGQCGWLKDKFGLSWQVTPAILGSLLGDPDRAKADRVMTAMLPMKKLDIAALQRAHAGK